MEASQIFATDVEVNIPGFSGFLQPIGLEILAKIESALVEERIACIPSVKEVLDGFDVKALGADFAKQIMSEVMFNFHDLNRRARSEVSLDDIVAELEKPKGLVIIMKHLLKRADGTNANDAEALKVFQYVSKHGMSASNCNFTRWFEISGLAQIPDPTKSES